MAATSSRRNRSANLAGLFERIRGGDRTARDELFTRFHDRIRRLTAVLLRTFPPVRQRREVESVANDLVIRLMRALEDPKLTLGTEGDFFRLAAHKLRLLLIDEAEKYRRRATVPGGDDGTDTLDPAALAEWTEFHERVAALPADERTVVEMHFFMNLPQREVARVLGWEPKKVSRRWLAACLKLADYLPTV